MTRGLGVTVTCHTRHVRGENGMGHGMSHVLCVPKDTGLEYDAVTVTCVTQCGQGGPTSHVGASGDLKDGHGTCTKGAGVQDSITSYKS